MSDTKTILQALVVAFGFTGQSVQPEVLAEMAKDLSRYPEADVVRALRRCRTELRHIQFNDILDRLPNQHPGKEEAWSLVQKAVYHEDLTICWTTLMAEASRGVFPLKEDRVAARMAFIEKYQQLVSEARDRRQPPQWQISEGYDKSLRQEAVVEARRNNQIDEATATRLLTRDLTKEEAAKLLDDLHDNLKRLGSNDDAR